MGETMKHVIFLERDNENYHVSDYTPYHNRVDHVAAGDNLAEILEDVIQRIVKHTENGDAVELYDYRNIYTSELICEGEGL